MANITPAQVLEQVDTLTPNQYSRAEKLRWLAQAEGFVLREIRGVTGPLTELTEGSSLSAEQTSAGTKKHCMSCPASRASGCL